MVLNLELKHNSGWKRPLEVSSATAPCSEEDAQALVLNISEDGEPMTSLDPCSGI